MQRPALAKRALQGTLAKTKRAFAGTLAKTKRALSGRGNLCLLMQRGQRRALHPAPATTLTLTLTTYTIAPAMTMTTTTHTAAPATTLTLTTYTIALALSLTLTTRTAAPATTLTPCMAAHPPQQQSPLHLTPRSSTWWMKMRMRTAWAPSLLLLLLPQLSRLQTTL